MLLLILKHASTAEEMNSLSLLKDSGHRQPLSRALNIQIPPRSGK